MRVTCRSLKMTRLLLAALCLVAPLHYGEAHLTIGAWNLGIYGDTKASKPDVLEEMAKVINQYDVILLQELKDVDASAFPVLLSAINNHPDNEYPFSFVISERLGATSSKEQYMFAFRDDKVTLLDTYQFPINYEEFARPPFSALFSTTKTEHLDKFVLIGIHAKPDSTLTDQEINKLVDVQDAAIQYFNEQNTFILGDLNADCAYWSATKRESNVLYNDRTNVWAIPDDADTTVSTTDCAYDRIIAKGSAAISAMNKTSAGVDYFTVTGPLEVSDVSDHYPVRVQLYGPGQSEKSLMQTFFSLVNEAGVMVNDFFDKYPNRLENSETSYTVEVGTDNAYLKVTRSEVSSPVAAIQDYAEEFFDLISDEMKDLLVTLLDDYDSSQTYNVVFDYDGSYPHKYTVTVIKI